MLTERARAFSRPVVEPIALAAGRLGLSPNRITILGMLSHSIVGAFFATGNILAGALALALASALDGLDGSLARATNRVTNGGAFLDSVLDRVSEVLVFGGLLYLMASKADPVGALLVMAALSGSLMVSYTRARSEGIGFGTKAGMFGRFERMAVLVVGLALGLVVPTLAVIAVGAWLTAGVRIMDVMRRCDEPEVAQP
jgi:CDP-diacylglycerol--glycerol-3-phosphate 3-phosphatidyltransferase